MPPRFIWDACSGIGLGHTIQRLGAHSGLQAFVTDVLPADVALSDVRLRHPELLARIVYIQVPVGHLPTHAWLDRAMRQHCAASAACIIEAAVGLPCGTWTTRHGRRPPRNPHRICMEGRWYPVTLEAALADRFRAVIFATFRRLYADNETFGCMVENPATSLLWEQPDVHAFICDMGCQVAVIDHCVVGNRPQDLEYGVSNKPSTWIFPAGSAVPDVRCRDLSCLHKLPGQASSFHRLVIQRPRRGSVAYLAGQRQMPVNRAACVPIGLYDILSLDRWCSAAVLQQLAAPCTLTAPPISSVPLPSTPAAAAPALPRLTPNACVYDATTLHAVFGHVATGAHLCDTVNQCVGFRMLRHDGSVVRAPHITVADVELQEHCPVCPCTQLKDVGSKHPRRRRGAASAAPALASVPVVPFDVRRRP